MTGCWLRALSGVVARAAAVLLAVLLAILFLLPSLLREVAHILLRAPDSPDFSDRNLPHRNWPAP